MDAPKNTLDDDGAGRPKAAPVLALLLLLMAAVLWWTVQPHNRFPLAVLAGTLVSWLLLAAAVRALRRIRPARTKPMTVGAVVIAGSLLLGLAVLSAPPATSNDSARYAWDGIVQNAGISPYAHVPLDESLVALRPSWLFAPGTAAAKGETRCAPDLFATAPVPTRGSPSGEPLCTAINRPNVPTIYPPTAELYFLGIRLAVPAAVGYLAFQVGGLLVSLAVTLLLLAALPRLGLPRYVAAVWAWSPLVLIEGVNNAHVDLLGGALLLASGLLLTAGKTVKPLRSGAMFGAAVATKLIPAIAAPALLFRRPVRFIGAALATFAMLYTPYVLTAGWSVIGFLPGYLKEEGYSDQIGIRFALAQFVAGGPWPMLLSAAALLALALTVLRRTTAHNVWEQQTQMIGLALLIISPNYPWYALMLLPFVILSRYWEYIGVMIALNIIYLLPGDPVFSGPVNRGSLAAAAAAIAVGAWRRRRASHLDCARHGLETTPEMAG
ncbi:MAG: glycosyltransferase 87 family protein [Actinomycetota bacterium]|nr:glycosyltransferase 87 family protein [Actinomycetota bacterium]